MNNKGFAVTGIIYSVLIIFLVMMTTMLFNLQNRKTILDELKLDAVDAVESDNNYEYLLSEINTLKAQIGDNDISGVGDGTITGIINELNSIQQEVIELTDNVIWISDNCYARRTGNVVNIRLVFTTELQFINDGYHIATIPEGYRPDTQFIKNVSLTNNVVAMIIIELDGKVTLKYATSDQTIPSTAWIYINESYITD